MPNIFSIFNLISIIYIFRSAQLFIQIWREWSEIIQEPLTQKKKYLAEQASYFIAVPIGVFFHELGHALAIWLFGGQVVGFTYRFFWGAVEPSGVFTPAESWMISLAGTIGSLLFGLGIWLLLRDNKVSSLRYFGVRAFRFQIYFALLYYPIFTVIFPIGDWRTIYDFSATPILSSVTMVFHVIFLILYWRYDRKGSFEAPAMETVAQQEQFEKLEKLIDHQMHDAKVQLAYVAMLRQGGALNRAQTHLKKVLAENPNAAMAYLELAIVEAAKSRRISKKAKEYAEEALQLGLSNDYQISAANRIIGKANFEAGESEAAIEAFSRAITAFNGTEKNETKGEMLAVLYQERSLAYRRAQKFDLAYADLSKAMSLAQNSGKSELTAVLEQEFAILEKHAGRKLGV